MNPEMNIETKRDNNNHHHTETAGSTLRHMLSDSLHKLDDRWNQVVHVGEKVRENPLPFILAGSGILLACAGGITYAVLQHRANQNFTTKLMKGISRLLKKVY